MVKVSGRYTKPGQPARWVCVEIESEEDAARRVLPPAPEGWELDAVVRGDHSEGSPELEAPDHAGAGAGDHTKGARHGKARPQRKAGGRR